MIKIMGLWLNELCGPFFFLTVSCCMGLLTDRANDFSIVSSSLTCLRNTSVIPAKKSFIDNDGRFLRLFYPKKKKQRGGRGFNHIPTTWLLPTIPPLCSPLDNTYKTHQSSQPRNSSAKGRLQDSSIKKQNEKREEGGFNHYPQTWLLPTLFSLCRPLDTIHKTHQSSQQPNPPTPRNF